MADPNDFVCGIYMHLHMHPSNIWNSWYIYIIFTGQIFDTYMGITCEVNVAVTCILVLFTEWTLASQTVDQTVRESYGTKSLYHFKLNLLY